MRIGLAQVNPTVADLPGNVERCLDAIDGARKQHADLVVLPEMVVPGYPPRDILYDPSFVEAAEAATADLAARAQRGPPVIAGSLCPADPRPGHPGLYNAAFLLHNGTPQLIAAKRLLPAYDVFYEPRWFLPGPAQPPTKVSGRQIGVLICEDLWDKGHSIHPASELIAGGADLLVCLSASPYRRGVMASRLDQARRTWHPLAYVNLWGANDELIFDGRSFCLDGEGAILSQLAAFAGDVQVVDLDTPPAKLDPGEDLAYEEELFQALVLGIRDFCHKNRLQRAFLGLSGGIDSAVVAVLAAEALGPEHVTAIAIPSRYSDERSTSSARDLAHSLGIAFEVIQLEDLHATAESTLGDLLSQGTAAENVQARLRALILMAFVNRYRGLLLNTSNKTELSLGYATIYGDMAGTLCPIADLTKPQVIALARWITEHCTPIPTFILERAPSAELRPDQVDPFDYPMVAPAMERLVRGNQSDAALRHSEHKRWQMGVVLKVSDKAFGTGRLMPVTRR